MPLIEWDDEKLSVGISLIDNRKRPATSTFPSLIFNSKVAPV